MINNVFKLFEKSQREHLTKRYIQTVKKIDPTVVAFDTIQSSRNVLQLGFLPHRWSAMVSSAVMISSSLVLSCYYSLFVLSSSMYDLYDSGNSDIMGIVSSNSSFYLSPFVDIGKLTVPTFGALSFYFTKRYFNQMTSGYIEILSKYPVGTLTDLASKSIARSKTFLTVFIFAGLFTTFHNIQFSKRIRMYYLSDKTPRVDNLTNDFPEQIITDRLDEYDDYHSYRLISNHLLTHWMKGVIVLFIGYPLFKPVLTPFFKGTNLIVNQLLQKLVKLIKIPK
eukprot:TRINITY_DN6287_c0_g2_i1.p1 TRINITY_DN6287_c0_g2~~TRINITY_DN6287_c0_g2_i1.p1  ORF type:complete len:280 (+),score=32.77 TRINITY_DN6287_c0_g2_i1:24-863(+)